VDIAVEQIKINGKTALGLMLNLSPAPLLVIKGEKGIIGCGFISVDAAEKLNLPAAIITGVKNFEEMLNKKVVKVSSAGREIGLREGLTGKEALKLII